MENQVKVSDAQVVNLIKNFIIKHKESPIVSITGNTTGDIKILVVDKMTISLHVSKLASTGREMLTIIVTNIRGEVCLKRKMPLKDHALDLHDMLLDEITQRFINTFDDEMVCNIPEISELFE